MSWLGTKNVAADGGFGKCISGFKYGVILGIYVKFRGAGVFVLKKVTKETTRTPSQCPVIFSELLRFKRIAPQSNGHFFVHHISRFYPIISIAPALCTYKSIHNWCSLSWNPSCLPTNFQKLSTGWSPPCLPPRDSTRFNSSGCAKKFDSNCYGDRPLHWFIGVAATPKCPPKKGRVAWRNKIATWWPRNQGPKLTP